MIGFLNVYKPKGITSHDVISRLRRVFKIKQIGHAGTLDPFAEGVLPVAVGKATRLLEYLSDDKAYIATVQFGKITDTYDIEGEVISTSDIKVTEEDVVNALKAFEGYIEQVPPMYSAIKVSGKKLYEYAREGKQVEVKSRRVKIYEIRLKNFDFETQTAEIYCKCSKGTYIRTIGYDLGQKLGCGAYLSALKRVEAGLFEVSESVSLDDITNETELIKPETVLTLPQFDINKVEFERVSHGLGVNIKANGFIVLMYNGKFVGIGEGVGDMIKVKKFVYED